MSEKRTVKYTRQEIDRLSGDPDWQRVKDLTDQEIDEAARSDPDNPPTDSAFWEDAAMVLPEPKKAAYVRLDRDVLDWFKMQGGYQARINAVLRAYMRSRTGAQS